MTKKYLQKISNKLLVIFLLFNIFSNQNPIFASIRRSYVADSRYSIFTLKGHSTLSNWSCISSDVSGEISLEITEKEIQSFLNQLVIPKPDPNLPDKTIYVHEITVPAFIQLQAEMSVIVTSFDCGNKIMEKDMHKAMKTKAYPIVEFKLSKINSITYIKGADPLRDIFKLNIEGYLTITDQTRSLVMEVVIRRQENGMFRALGQRSILMTRFNIDPPRAIFGLIKAYDQVQIIFDLYFVDLYSFK